MNLSMNELVVLGALGGSALKKDELAYAAARLFPSTKFDAQVALAEISTLEARKLIEMGRDKRYSITREGHNAVLEAIQPIERLRAALAMTTYRYVR